MRVYLIEPALTLSIDSEISLIASRSFEGLSMQTVLLCFHRIHWFDNVQSLAPGGFLAALCTSVCTPQTQELPLSWQYGGLVHGDTGK